MAEIKTKIDVKLTITMTLTEAEAGFLEGMSGFNHEELLEAIRGFCGKHYTELTHFQEFEGDGFRSLMSKCQSELPSALRKVKEARKAYCQAIGKIAY